MKVAFYSPMPPARTGVAHYASMLVPELRKHVEVEVNPSNEERATSNAIYQLGNNPHHESIYREAMRNPGIAVLHDIVLHHLIVEMTLARGDADGYVDAMRANHGEAGAAWARGRIIGLHDEIANFLFPASIEVANRSRAVIVHNNWAAERLRDLGVSTPIYVVPHPYVPRWSGGLQPADGALKRTAPQFAVGLFGFLTSAKRAEVVLEVFRIARAREPRLSLLIVGEPAPNIRVPSGEGITVTGYVDDLDPFYDRVDRLVNLRYPSAGETSGTLIRAFDAGKPVAVSDYAQFAELPDDCVVKIPFGPEEVPRLVEFFLRDHASPARAQRRWLEENATLELTVEGYLNALNGVAARFSAPNVALKRDATLALFPNLSMSWNGKAIILTNDGDTTLRAGEYGQPGYRAILKWDATDRWIRLPKDLHPGESVAIELPATPPVTLTHALEGIPIVDERPAAEVR